tara:strand:+ start:2650 stop:2829 length:180 start_codon:yes stop_codon:yes gene_type:complete
MEKQSKLKFFQDMLDERIDVLKELEDRTDLRDALRDRYISITKEDIKKWKLKIKQSKEN